MNGPMILYAPEDEGVPEPTGEQPSADHQVDDYLAKHGLTRDGVETQAHTIRQLTDKGLTGAESIALLNKGLEAQDKPEEPPVTAASGSAAEETAVSESQVATLVNTALDERKRDEQAKSWQAHQQSCLDAIAEAKKESDVAGNEVLQEYLEGSIIKECSKSQCTPAEAVVNLKARFAGNQKEGAAAALNQAANATDQAVQSTQPDPSELTPPALPSHPVQKSRLDLTDDQGNYNPSEGDMTQDVEVCAAAIKASLDKMDSQQTAGTLVVPT